MADGLAAPVVRLRRPRLFIDAQHGLCNRLRAMASAAALAQATERDMVVVWRPDHHCDGHLSDLFIYPGAVIDDDAADACRAAAGVVYNYMEIEPGARFQEPVLPDPARFEGQDVYIRSAYTLASPLRNVAAEEAFLRGLIPCEAVRDLVARVRRPNRVALHVRSGTGPGFDHLSYESPQNWPAHRHAELVEWRKKSDAAVFMVRLDELIAAGAADTVFLASDRADTYAAFADRYGERVACLQRDLFDRSARQLQFALADLLLLAAADRFLASSWSAFSDIAQKTARPGRPFEQSGKDF